MNNKVTEFYSRCPENDFSEMKVKVSDLVANKATVKFQCSEIRLCEILVRLRESSFYFQSILD